MGRHFFINNMKTKEDPMVIRPEKDDSTARANQVRET